jgi:hypothetical protein
MVTSKKVKLKKLCHKFPVFSRKKIAKLFEEKKLFGFGVVAAAHS